jgi:hypothetical protein
MSRRFGVLKTGFALSIVLHGGLFVWMSRLEWSFAAPTKHSRTVSVRIQPEQIVQRAQEKPSSTLERASAHSRKEKSTQKQELNANPRSDVRMESVPETKEALKPYLRNGFSYAPAGSSPSQVQADQEQEVKAPSFKTGMTSPCRQLGLPSQWAQLKGVWPRKYRVELQWPQHSGATLMTIRSMQPVDEPLQALDLRVQQAFSECLKKQDSMVRNALANRSGALNPSAGEAYSAVIEFYPDSPSVAAQ